MMTGFPPTLRRTFWAVTPPGTPGVARRVGEIGQAGKRRPPKGTRRDGPRNCRRGPGPAPRRCPTGDARGPTCRTARMALPVSSVVVSFWASHSTTQGWFHRSRIHSRYSWTSSSLLKIDRPMAVVPDGKFVLDEQALFVGDLVPSLRRKADAVADRVPVHVAKHAVQSPHPVVAPRQIAPFRVFEEAEDAHVGAAEKIGLAVEHGVSRLRVEAEAPHPESGAQRVARRGNLQFIEKRVFRRPESAALDGNAHVQRLAFVRRSAQGACRDPTSLPDRAFADAERPRARRAGRHHPTPQPPVPLAVPTRARLARSHVAACPDRINSTES